jgi:hypothetical protein
MHPVQDVALAVVRVEIFDFQHGVKKIEPRRTQRILFNTPLRGARRKNKNEEKQLGDKSEVTVREPVPPTFAGMDCGAMKGFHPNSFFCSCLSSVHPSRGY